MAGTGATRGIALTALVAAALGLAACTATPDPAPATTAPAQASAAPTEEPVAAPALVADGSAAENLTFFAAVVDGVWGGADPASGRAYVDALVANGFDRAAMQVTRDESTVGNLAESIQFSVRWGGECLVGQVGPATGDPVTAVLPGLAEGGCLVGDTRPIDW